MAKKESEVDRLKAELAEAKADLAKAKTVTFKVSDKEAVSVYGLQRFPVTLYGDQWRRLLEKADELLEFIEENKDKLNWKK